MQRSRDMLRHLPRPFFVLAPMDDVTDTVFRQIVASCAPPDVFFTEFVNVDGLQSPGRRELLKKLRFTGNERPLIAQIWGKDPERYRATARELVKMGFAGIDINMGCPVKTVVRNGCCSALINNRQLASGIIKATQEGAGGEVPVSVKTRLGFSQTDLSWHAWLLQHNLDMLTIHGRTTKQMSDAAADWEQIGAVRALRDELAGGTLIVGNGDVRSRRQGAELSRQYQLDGVMIGRGVFRDPFVFAAASPWAGYTRARRIALYRYHVELFAATWREGERRIATLNKFCKVYIADFDGAKELREQLMAAASTSELLSLIDSAG